MNQDTLVGSWKLASFSVVDEGTLEEVQPWGVQPLGRMIFTPSGHMSATLSASTSWTPPPGDERREMAARRPTLAYTGAYRVEGSSFITSVDTSWPDGWVGTEQRRDFTVDADRLTITTLPHTTPDGATRHGVLVWNRER